MERTLKEMDACPPKHADDSTDFIKKLVTHLKLHYSSNENVKPFFLSFFHL
jgi:hypothetical protein